MPEIIRSLRSESAVLLIAGEGPERENIELGIRNYELWDKVRFLGRVPNNEIQNYFGIADVFILPSEEEGFPHVLLEAMAAGVPFVVFDVGGVGEIIPPELLNYLISKNDIVSFSDKLREILNKKAPDLEALRRAELDWVRQFDSSAAIKKFQSLLA